MKQFKTGTLIAGTHRAEDLYPVFREAIKALDTKKECTEWPEITDPRLYDSDGVNDFDIPDMIADLENLAPEGYYFGTHPGDGADFGFWRNEQ